MSEATTPPGSVPVDRVHTPLLTLITQQSLDEDYRLVAQRRAAEPAAADRGRGRLAAAVVVAAFGVMVTIAALQTSAGQDVRSASRTTLISQIDDGRAELAGLQGRIVRLRELDVGLQSRLDAVTTQQLTAESRQQRLATSTGFGAVTGPGVQVTVDDAPDGTQVRDLDLRPLVNGLWQAGAEAIAVNGQRLTSRSAIRNSGVAIRVNNRSLSPPYVVSAIGNEKTLQADLMQTTSGLLFRNTVESVGFPWSMDNVDHLYLPAAPARVARLRSAVEGTAKQVQDEQHRKEAPE